MSNSVLVRLGAWGCMGKIFIKLPFSVCWLKLLALIPCGIILFCVICDMTPFYCSMSSSSSRFFFPKSKK